MKKNGEPQRYSWGTQKNKKVNPRDIGGERRRRRSKASCKQYYMPSIYLTRVQEIQ